MPRTDEYSRLSATKAGREKCLTAMRLVAAQHGATIELHEFNGKREIGLELMLGPFSCMIHFDGECRSGSFMGHWHMHDYDSKLTYPDTFWRVGSVNNYHKQKATTFCDTLAEFEAKLAEGLMLLADTIPAHYEYAA